MHALQDRYAPSSICFGCGPANPKGLQIKSVVEEDLVVARWRPADHHEAFPGMLNGGIIGALLDCHCNWTGAWALMARDGLERPPTTVTAEYAIKLLRPTPSAAEVVLRARAVSLVGSKATIEGQLWVEDQICATCTGLFVAVKPGHPAYHRW